MKNVLVTGCAGFIGSHFVDFLLAKDISVFGVDNLFRGSLLNLDQAQKNSNFHFHNIDLSSHKCISRLADLLDKHNIDSISHFAAINGTQYFYDSSYFVLDQNIKISQNLFSAIDKSSAKINTILYTSSSEAYGDPLVLPTDERQPIILNSDAARDSYSVSKVVGDFYTKLFCESRGITFYNCRLFNQYGPRMVGSKYGQVIGEFIQRILGPESFYIIGDGSHTRSFCFVQDCVQLLYQLSQSNADSGVYNIGNDCEISILELAQKIHQMLDVEFTPSFLPARVNDHKRRQPCNNKLIASVGNFNFTPLEVGLKLTIDSFI